jgi:hypothetical protein
MKILVIGYQRSGTTLLRRLIRLHPDVIHILHEKRILRHGKNKKQILKYVKNFSECKNCTMTNTWGEKVPFYGSTGGIGSAYCKKWVKTFGNEARIIYIVRHPLDIAISNVKMARSKAKSVSKLVKILQNIYPSTFEDLKYHQNVVEKMMIISFETLVTKPEESLKRIFEFCNLNTDDKIVKRIAGAKKKQLRYFDGINSDRAFAYKKQGYDDSGIDYESVREYESIVF